jgi:hypothetical protein
MQGEWSGLNHQCMLEDSAYEKRDQSCRSFTIGLYCMYLYIFTLFNQQNATSRVKQQVTCQPGFIHLAHGGTKTGPKPMQTICISFGPNIQHHSDLTTALHMSIDMASLSVRWGLRCWGAGTSVRAPGTCRFRGAPLPTDFV